jgi:hypothetical protein
MRVTEFCFVRNEQYAFEQITEKGHLICEVAPASRFTHTGLGFMGFEEFQWPVFTP